MAETRLKVEWMSCYGGQADDPPNYAVVHTYKVLWPDGFSLMVDVQSTHETAFDYDRVRGFATEWREKNAQDRA